MHQSTGYDGSRSSSFIRGPRRSAIASFIFAVLYQNRMSPHKRLGVSRAEAHFLPMLDMVEAGWSRLHLRAPLFRAVVFAALGIPKPGPENRRPQFPCTLKTTLNPEFLHLHAALFVRA